MADGGTLQLIGYTVLRHLGEGASGSVLLVRHDATGSIAAVKVLSPALSADPGFLKLFRAEAEILRSLRHPHVAALYWYVEADAVALLAMEAIDGVALRNLVATAATTPEAALVTLQGSLDALEHAHRAGIVHRDYKPENVLVDRAGSSHLVDFGIAVRTGSREMCAGTPPYMAPEQWGGSPATPATDVYAAAVVLFECVVGRRPFNAPDLEGMRLQHASAEPAIDEVPAPLRDLVRRGLAKNATSRYDSAGAFLRNLEEAARAGYGPDWERRGALVLAGAVGALPFLLGTGSEGAAPGGSSTVTATNMVGAAMASAIAPPPPDGITTGSAAVHAAVQASGSAAGPLLNPVTPHAEALAAARPAPQPATAPPPSPPTAPPVRRPRGFLHPSPLVAAGATAAIAVVAITAGVVATRGGNSSTAAATPAPVAIATSSASRSGSPTPTPVPTSTATAVAASVAVDVRGTWSITPSADPAQYPQTLTVVSEDVATGAIAGTATGPAGAPSFTVTGTARGSNFVWTATGGSGPFTFTSTVAAVPAGRSMSGSIAGPAQADANCGREAGLRSTAGTEKANINFVNHTTHAVQTLWLDYQGHRVFYGQIPAGSSYTQPTWLTHPWVVADLSGKCETLYVTTSQQQTVDVGSAPAIAFTATAPPAAATTP